MEPAVGTEPTPERFSNAPMAAFAIAHGMVAASSPSADTSGPVWDQLRKATAVADKWVPQSFYNRNGHSGQVPEEIEMLRNAVLGNLGAVSSGRRHIKTVCEIGFNAGHSATVRAREP